MTQTFEDRVMDDGPEVEILADPIVFGVTADGADEQFHLMGKHDQRTHGGHTSSEDARVAQKLNNGEKLDPKVDSERRTLAGIAGWTHNGDFSKYSDEKGSDVAFDDQVAHAALHNADVDSVAGSFARTVAAAPPTAPALHRGVRDVTPSKVPRVGETMDITPSSFSQRASVAERFAGVAGHSRHTTPSGTQVIMHVEPGSRALAIQQHGGTWAWEKEHVGMGRYQVTGRKDYTKKIKLSDGSKVDVSITELHVKQVDFSDAPPSFTREMGLGDTGG